MGRPKPTASVLTRLASCWPSDIGQVTVSLGASVSPFIKWVNNCTYLISMLGTVPAPVSESQLLL